MVAPTTVDGAAQQQASAMNSSRLSAVADQLASHMQRGSAGDPKVFLRLCLLLARGIDYSVANNVVPAKAESLPPLLKQICQCKTDIPFRAGVMLLMVSVKNACKLGWFAEQDSEVLRNLSKEVGSAFSSPRTITANPSDLVTTVNEIIARFFPFMMLREILAFHEQKPGFEALAIDFHVAKNPAYTDVDQIYLFVAHKDSIETSACLISPQQVSFVLNGLGVKDRYNRSMDSGPQMPTNFCGMLVDGTNLLQAIGQFSGHYIIIVGFMRMLSTPDTPRLPDYVQFSTVAEDSDVDVVEGASRISLDCPISQKRIRTPVKGRTCKHLQPFDFHNYININSRRPSWRCPNCNRDVCYTDLRIDQNIVQVLKEVGDHVGDVIISEDGSWHAVFKSDEQSVHVHDETLSHQNDGTRQQEHRGFSDGAPDVLDLTGDDDEMEDRKPIATNPQSQSATTNITAAPNLNNASAFHLSLGADIDNSFLSRFDLYSSGASSVHMQGMPSSSLHHHSAVQVGAFANVPLTDPRSHASPVHMPGMLSSSPQYQSAVQNWNHQGTQSGPHSRAAAPGLRPSFRSQMQTQQRQVRVNHAPNTVNSSQSRFMVTPQRTAQTTTVPVQLQLPRTAQTTTVPIQLQLPRTVPVQLQLPRTAQTTTVPIQLQLPRTTQTRTVPVQLQLPRTAQTTTVPVQIQSPRTVPPQYRNGTSARSDLTNLQPPRMRGSLLPGSYPSDLDSLIIRPTQPSQIERPVSQSQLPPTQSAQQLSRPPGIPPNWQQRH